MNNKITFCTYDAPSFHGPNSWLKRLLPDLKENNFVIEVLIFFEGDLNNCETYNYFLSPGFKVHTFPFKSIAEDKIKWILTTISNDPPGVFVPNMLVHTLFAARWVKEAGIPTVGLLHSDDKFYQAVIDEFVKDHRAFQLTAVVSCSKYLHNKLERLNLKNIRKEFIPYGVPAKNAPVAIFSGKGLKLIYVGRLIEEQKRISEVTRAFCLAAQQIDNVEGVLYGEGETGRVISMIKKYKCENKVRYGGLVKNTEIYQKLSEGQIFVLLSDYEGLPQALLEAMACGLIPVCYQMESGIPELVVTDETGIIVKDRHADFIKPIKELRNNLPLCQKISKNAREKIAHEYSSGSCSGKWIQLLNELISVNTSKKQIPVPDVINLPKPHPDLKREDFRKPNFLDKVSTKINDSFLVKSIKKSLRPLWLSLSR
jgi:glycosyltransferase involved in cell wall biosynthesis